MECGDHYVRPMASWALLEAASGYQYDAPRASLAFAPRIDPDDFCSFFITGGAGGTFSQEGGSARVSVHCGSLAVRQLCLASSASAARVQLDGQPLVIEAEQVDGCLYIRSAEPITIAAGEALSVDFA